MRLLYILFGFIVLIGSGNAAERPVSNGVPRGWTPSPFHTSIIFFYVEQYYSYFKANQRLAKIEVSRCFSRYKQRVKGSQLKIQLIFGLILKMNVRIYQSL